MSDTLVSPPVPITFHELGVPDFVCEALEARGVTHPFAIQAATIADALAGRDVSGAAPTGSGKTLAFGVPLVALTERGRPHHPKALVLAPTRELADQISEELSTLSKRVRVAAVYGGVGYGAQTKALKAGVDILVACPGRLEDLIAQGRVRLSEVERVVLDEADRMADMGFMPAVRRILDLTTGRRQTVLFSATLDGDVARLISEYQSDPVRHEVATDTSDVVAADHVFWTVPRTERTALLAAALRKVWPAIVFCRTRHGADRLAKQLASAGVSTVAIHGGRSQQQRTRALEDFTRGRVQAMIATDVAARGIHVDDVATVVHFDVPEDHKAYIHRSGRTARAGRGGLVISLIEPNGSRAARRMQREVGIEAEITAPDLSAIESHADPSRVIPRPSERAQTDQQAPSGRSERSGHGNANRSGKPHRNGKPNGNGKQNGYGKSSGYSRPSDGKPNGNNQQDGNDGSRRSKARASGRPDPRKGSGGPKTSERRSSSPGGQRHNPKAGAGRPGQQRRSRPAR
ncbi:MAG: DEAD/DEAH box helicase [Ilumatobacteraceae bacterium]|jgi:superfamily II DNA/RNA helicase|nr:DEAD/DEAH box helicase [Actinomycetota bacterium]